MAPIRLLFYLPDLDGGGAQRTLLNLAAELNRSSRCDVTVLTGRATGPAERWIDPDLPTAVLPGNRAREQIFSLRREVKSRNPDILFSTMLHGNLAAWFSTRLMIGKPKLVLRETNSHRHRDDLSTLLRWLAGLAYRGADRVIALSHGVQQELEELYRLSVGQVETIHNPVRIDAFEAASPARQIPRTELRILTIGRLAHQKNHADLLRAVAKLGDLPIRLTILGEGPLRADLTTLATELSLQERVEMPGFVEDPGAYLSQADVFVLSSRYEGFGHVLVEAMAAGLPVVSTDCPYGPKDIITSLQDGILVPNEDPDGLAKAILDIWNDADLRDRLSKNGIARAREFDVGSISERYLRTFHDCLTQGK